ncbi:unnamed protein product [Prorocentrum cordatum]|uniref:Uncharacterized protein n=1 Tax=Prorocentrum cordatum TaxID=2364126 RepID=A0ABN9PZC6_9DINO|nr:unnamed protein product [Polarella glacialis]
MAASRAAGPETGRRGRAASGDGDATPRLLRRVGLSVVATNAEYGRRARQEAEDAERELDELRRDARRRAALCRGHLRAADAKERAEEERRAVAERVSLELHGFREQMRQKEAEDEDRVRHLYRALLGPAGGAAPALPGSAPPGLLVSEGPLDQGDLGDHGGRGAPAPPWLLHAGGTSASWPSEAPPSRPPAGRRRAPGEADALLRRNLARLERLERLGL